MNLKDKFTPLTNVKPSDNPEEINLKEQEPQDEPVYLEENNSPEPIPITLEDVQDTPKPQQNTSPQAEIQATSTADYADYQKLEKEKHSWKWLIIVFVLLVAIGGIYWFMLRSKPVASTTPENSTNPTASSAAPSTTSSTATSKISATTKSYTSSNFNLAFSYPDDWVVADTGSGVLTAKSPSIQLKNSTGASVTGQIVFTIRNASQKLTEFDSGNSTATRDSVKIAYAKPTQTQRGNTYMSFLQYSTTMASGGLDSIFITGDSGYKKAQAIPLVDVSKVDPRITISFVDANSKALTIADSMWDDSTFSDSLTNILKSLSIN